MYYLQLIQNMDSLICTYKKLEFLYPQFNNINNNVNIFNNNQRQMRAYSKRQRLIYLYNPFEHRQIFCYFLFLSKGLSNPAIRFQKNAETKST